MSCSSCDRSLPRYRAAASFAHAAPRRAAEPRARDLGVPFDGTPGPLNAITDVAGVMVGHTTLISGSGKLKVGQGPVRTGVTAVLPRGNDSPTNPVFAGWFSQNGNGEMTGTTWVEESGFLEGPVMITNTHSVGVVRDAVIQWRVAHGSADTGRATGGRCRWSAETWDGWLNDINGFHVKPEHAFTRSTPRTRAGRGRQRRRRHRHDLQRLQRRHRHLLAPAGRQGRRLHGRRAGAVQLRHPRQLAHRRHQRRARNPGARTLRLHSLGHRRARLHHRDRGDRRAAAARTN